MENLSEKVYECSLAVEAHMVCDLLSQAGISARVDGEFMQSAMGEIPVGNAVKVRVDPMRAAEAREVIADWEKQQPVDPIAVPVTKTARFKSSLWFFIGLVVGATFVYLHFYRVYDVKNEYDRNHDGRMDARWTVDWQGYWNHYEEDNDFDGRFEWQFEVEGEGFFKRAVLDADGDGRPEQVTNYAGGVADSIDFHYASGGRIVKRQFFKGGLLDAAEFDDDGDGIFERRMQYDAHGEPKL
jgi:hypothetical protein